MEEAPGHLTHHFISDMVFPIKEIVRYQTWMLTCALAGKDEGRDEVKGRGEVDVPPVQQELAQNAEAPLLGGVVHRGHLLHPSLKAVQRVHLTIKAAHRV